jgi:hypothetical protein
MTYLMLCLSKKSFNFCAGIKTSSNRLGHVRLSSLCGPHKKPGTLFPAEIIAVRGNCFSLRYVALTLETKNQFLSLIEWVPVSLKTSCPAGGEKDVDDEENKVNKHQKDK